MVALFVVSADAADGKTAVCAGLGKYLLGEGKKVSFLKPVVAGKRTDTDSDGAFMKQVLALPEPVDSLCPLISDERSLADRIREAYIEVS